MKFWIDGDIKWKVSRSVKLIFSLLCDVTNLWRQYIYKRRQKIYYFLSSVIFNKFIWVILEIISSILVQIIQWIINWDLYLRGLLDGIMTECIIIISHIMKENYYTLLQTTPSYITQYKQEMNYLDARI